MPALRILNLLSAKGPLLPKSIMLGRDLINLYPNTRCKLRCGRHRPAGEQLKVRNGSLAAKPPSARVRYCSESGRVREVRLGPEGDVAPDSTAPTRPQTAASGWRGRASQLPK